MLLVSVETKLNIPYTDSNIFSSNPAAGEKNHIKAHECLKTSETQDLL